MFLKVLTASHIFLGDLSEPNIACGDQAERIGGTKTDSRSSCMYFSLQIFKPAMNLQNQQYAQIM